MSTIRDIIAAATPGPWQTIHDESGVLIAWVPRHPLGMRTNVVCRTSNVEQDGDKERCARFIATFNPEHIALMEDVREAASSWWRSGGENPDTVGAALLNLEGYRRERGLEVG